ncbi:hypothetical protein J3F83DRAFT_731590 [Trichoderma novae-zelandiae]
MTQPPGIERIETADEYGRRERCFRNHRRHPFTFQSHVPGIQSTRQATEKDGLVAQQGVRIVALPNPQLTEDIFDRDQRHRDDLDEFLQDSPSKLSFSYSGSSLKDLYLPVGELDLGSCPDKDLQECLQEVRAKRNRSPFRHWLPLAHTRTERDEGLRFPPGLNRLWAQLNRELDVDKPVLSGAATELVKEQGKTLTTLEYKELFAHQTRLEPYQYSRLDPISPPLSPVSDDAEPYIPNRDVAVIDLASEPSTPGRSVVEAIERDLDSDPIVSSTFMTSPCTGDLPRLIQTCRSVIQDAKTEAPVVLTSSDAPSEDNALADIRLPLIGDADEGALNLLEEKGHFEDAFMTLLEDRKYYANQLVNQECFDPVDSACRIAVPLLDFDIQPPEWTIGHLTAEMHFTVLRKSMPNCFELFPVPRDPRSEMSLRWAFFPTQKGQPMLKDELAMPDGVLAKYLSDEEISHLSSRDFVSIKTNLEVFRIQDDEEIEETFLQDDEANEEPPFSTQQNESLIETSLTQTNMSINADTQGVQNFSRPVRRKLDDDAVRLLPKSYDTSATSILLHNFMELRGVKRPRLNTEPSAASQPSSVLPSKPPAKEAPKSTDREATLSGIAKEMPPAPAPQFELPPEKSSIIISVDLPRQILRRMETSWTPEDLIDMDYTRHNTENWPPGASCPKEITSPLSFEADISLSASTGIIITNILKVRQRPLPGSQSLAPLRERIQKVSQKYEKLIVLVSESNSQGEVMGALTPSDTAAYAELVSFAAALGGDVDVHFVAGATETMGSWVVAYMCRYSPQSAALSRFLSSEETPWELLLRRAGMNVFAAKVLSGTLFEQAGQSGLAAFLGMPVGERVMRYGSLLGGERVLLTTGKVLDRRWGD